jgi:hypothetical protein
MKSHYVVRLLVEAQSETRLAVQFPPFPPTYEDLVENSIAHE